ncbi:MAG: dTMP kinase [Chloroflexota bacterium]
MFITFEGTEGSGKTTQIKTLGAYLTSNGFDVVVTREPGGTDIGRQIRQVLHDVKNGEMVSEAEILLYASDRAQHVNQLIRPALERGAVVLCDRFIDSTFAYQGYGRELSLENLKLITRFATGGLIPDLTLYLHVDPEEGLRRRKKGDLEMNRMDLQTQAFYGRVESGYAALMAADPQRWEPVDASGSINAVQEIIQAIVSTRIARFRA